MPSPTPPLPTFLIIGAQKSATRWLRLNLGDHPEIFAADEELTYFNVNSQYRRLGVDGYRGQFAGWEGQPIVGESTPGYMMMRHRPEVVSGRIQDTVPEVRLLAVLRNPVDRANSAMVHHIKRGRIAPDANLVDLVRATPPGKERFGLVSGGWYAASLAPFRERFGDQLLVLLHDDVRDDPRGVYRAALAHVGASPDHLPADLEQVRYSNQVPSDSSDDTRRSTSSVKSVVRAAIRRERPAPATPPFQPRELTAPEREELFAYFAEDIDELEEMTGIDLDRWRPNR